MIGFLYFIVGWFSDDEIHLEHWEQPFAPHKPPALAATQQIM